MDFRIIANLFDALFATTKRLEKTQLIAQVLKKYPKDAQHIVYLLQGRIYPVWNNQNLGVSTQSVIKALQFSSGYSKTQIIDRWKKTGDLGDVAHELMQQKQQQTLFEETLTLEKVFSNLDTLANAEGKGSADAKVKYIADLLSSAKENEARYIVRLALEVLRVGVGQSSIRDALCWAFLPKVNHLFGMHENEIVPIDQSTQPLDKSDSAPPEPFTLTDASYYFIDDYQKAREVYDTQIQLVQKALDIYNDVGLVATYLANKEFDKILEATPQIEKPLQVMLAKKVTTIEQGFKDIGTPLVAEYKYDGFRMQIHKNKDAVTIFTRRLENVTEQFPEVKKAVQTIKAQTCIIDCEAVGYEQSTKKYTPFQKISQRIKRKHNIAKMQEELPVELNVFDILFHDGQSTIDLPFSQRRKLLESIIEENPLHIVLSKKIETDDPQAVQTFYQEALKDGQEGLMLKKTDAPYKPGSRVGFMVKLKPTMDPLDLVITKATYGEGKRANWLTSFTLSCLNEDNELVEIGKVGTGFSEDDAELSFANLTKILEPLIIKEDGKDVVVKPDIVMEVSYEEIQQSNNYSSGYALRFPRVNMIRHARGIDSASTLEQVEEYYDQDHNR